MPWFILFLASLFEVAWVASLKRVTDFTDITNIFVSLSLLLLSVGLLMLASKSIPISAAYAVWTASGAIGALIVGVLMYGEVLSIEKLLCLGLIILGVVGLKVFQGQQV